MAKRIWFMIARIGLYASVFLLADLDPFSWRWFLLLFFLMSISLTQFIEDILE